MEEIKTPESKAKPKSMSKKTIIIIAIILALFCVLPIIAIILFVIFYNPLPIDTIIFNEEGTTNNEVTNTEVDGFGTVENDNPQCNLPIVDFKANAFSIGVPKGWLYSVEAGTVSIRSDESNTTAAFLYTAKLEKDLTPAQFLEKFGYIFEQTIKNVNGTFELFDISSNEHYAQGTINSTIGSDVMTGLMKVDLENDFVVFKSYWAPTQEYEAQKPLLEQITGCFGRTKIITDELLSGTLSEDGQIRNQGNSPFKAYQGSYFKLSKPDNFSVTGETDSGIDMTRSDGNAGYSYAYATGFTGGYTPKSWAEKALPQYAKISNLSLSNEQNIPSTISGQVIKSFDFTGTLNGYIGVKGKTTVGIYSTPYIGFGDQYTSAFWGIQIATPSEWTNAAPVLQQIQDSLEIIDIGATRKNTLLPPNRPMEDYSSSSVTSSSSYSDSKYKSSEEEWSDAMRGYETVTSPSTGQNYDVPLNSWSSYGPEGPGYYRQLPNNSLEKLQ